MEATTSAERESSGGPAVEPKYDNLAKAFQATADRLGDETAIRMGDYAISWADLRKRVAAIAGGLADLGVGKGDTVAIMLNNRPEFIPIDMAAVTLGAAEGQQALGADATVGGADLGGDQCHEGVSLLGSR